MDIGFIQACLLPNDNGNQCNKMRSERGVWPPDAGPSSTTKVFEAKISKGLYGEHRARLLRVTPRSWYFKVDEILTIHTGIPRGKSSWAPLACFVPSMNQVILSSSSSERHRVTVTSRYKALMCHPRPPRYNPP